MGKKVIKSSGISLAGVLGTVFVICFIGFFTSFIYRFITAEKADSTKQWCPTHNTYHDISEEVDDEVWCNNCKTWHPPRDESATPSIK